MKNTTHKPPYRAVQTALDGICIYSGDDYVCGAFDERLDETCRQEIAEDMVRACNVHDELVEAAKAYANMLCAHSSKEEEERIDALIAKAEGR